MRLLDLMENTTRYFAKNGVESPRLTIELMLAEVLQKSRLQLYLDFEHEVPEAVLDRLRPLVKQRAEGVPLEYVLGVTSFAGTRFKVTPDVLIPRPETEILLETVCPLIKPGEGTVIDVGTGSGILAITLARRFPEIPVIGLDISDAALAVACENGKDVPNIEWKQSNLLSAAPESFQGIVANLPYIPTETIPTLSREVQKEPNFALDGGPDGLDLIRRLIQENNRRARWIALEIGDGQADAVKSLFKDAGYTVTQCIKDLREVERIMVGVING